MNSERSSFLLPEKVGSGHETAGTVLADVVTGGCGRGSRIRSRTSSWYVKMSASSSSGKVRWCSERQGRRRRYNAEDGIFVGKLGGRTVEKTTGKTVEKTVGKKLEELGGKTVELKVEKA
jgi:hypothetical protein